jgi:hypothetical protein
MVATILLQIGWIWLWLKSSPRPPAGEDARERS